MFRILKMLELISCVHMLVARFICEFELMFEHAYAYVFAWPGAGVQIYILHMLNFN